METNIIEAVGSNFRLYTTSSLQTKVWRVISLTEAKDKTSGNEGNLLGKLDLEKTNRPFTITVDASKLPGFLNIRSRTIHTFYLNIVVSYIL